MSQMYVERVFFSALSLYPPQNKNVERRGGYMYARAWYTDIIKKGE